MYSLPSSALRKSCSTKRGLPAALDARERQALVGAEEASGESQRLGWP